MLGTILNVMVIFPYPPQLQEEQKDLYVLDQDNNTMKENLENRSWSIWFIIMLQTILDVMVIFPYPPQLQEEHKDPCVLDQESNIMQKSYGSTSVF